MPTSEPRREGEWLRAHRSSWPSSSRVSPRCTFAVGRDARARDQSFRDRHATDLRIDLVCAVAGRPTACVHRKRGRPQKFWIRPLDQTLPQPLAGTEGAGFPFWAPDSRSIGFFADGKLKRLDLGGGAPVALADAPIGLGGSWSPNGTILFAAFERLRITKLMRVPATGGVATEVPIGDGPPGLPDGRRLWSVREVPGFRSSCQTAGGFCFR